MLGNIQVKVPRRTRSHREGISLSLSLSLSLSSELLILGLLNPGLIPMPF
jgi:hypothetical protein